MMAMGAIIASQAALMNANTLAMLNAQRRRDQAALEAIQRHKQREEERRRREEGENDEEEK